MATGSLARPEGDSKVLDHTFVASSPNRRQMFGL
jgi:hypothetical protein